MFPNNNSFDKNLIDFMREVGRLFKMEGLQFGSEEREILTEIYNTTTKSVDKAFDIYSSKYCGIGGMDKSLVKKTDQHALDLPFGKEDGIYHFSTSDIRDLRQRYNPKFNDHRLALNTLISVAKYMKGESDFINLIKVRKMYSRLLCMFKYNPIDNVEIFPNVQTRHYYTSEGRERYLGYNSNLDVIWYDVDYNNVGEYPDSTVLKKVTMTSFPDLCNAEVYKVPDIVTDIKKGLFSNVGMNLKYIDLNNVKVIGEEAFYRSGIEGIVIPYGVKVIPDNCFFSCSSLKYADLPEGVIEIGNGAFSRCNSLQMTRLPSTIKKIGKQAFYECSLITIDVIPNDVYEIGESAFECCSLVNCNIPITLKHLTKNAFKDTGMKFVVIPFGVSTIDEFCFSCCKNLTTVYILDRNTTVSKDAFYSSNKIVHVSCPENTMQSVILASLPNLYVISDVASPRIYIKVSENKFVSSDILTNDENEMYKAVVYWANIPDECISRCKVIVPTELIKKRDQFKREMD